MKLIKKEGAESSTIRIITTGDGKVMGTVGRVNDLFSNGLIGRSPCVSEFCKKILETEYSWLCIPEKEFGSCNCYGDTREEAIVNAIAS